MHSRFLTALLLPGLVACHALRLPTEGRPVGATAAQALIGATEFHKLEFERADPADPTNTVEADISTMPALGVVGQTSLAGQRVELGVDVGLVVSWDSDRTAAVSTQTGTTVFFVDRRLFVGDLFLGPYVSTTLGDRLRIYAGAGASLMYGDADYSDELLSESDTAFGVGGYGRGGVELRVREGFLGVGVRWVATELDFGGSIGDVDVEGWQGFLTFTQGF